MNPHHARTATATRAAYQGPRRVGPEPGSDILRRPDILRVRRPVVILPGLRSFRNRDP